jgi:hypothetical protein
LESGQAGSWKNKMGYTSISYIPMFDMEAGALQMGLFTARTSPRPRKTLAVLKYKITGQTASGSNAQLLPFARQRSGDVGKVIVDLFFPNPYRPGQLPRIHLLFG